jgi:hypothetical protein
MMVLLLRVTAPADDQNVRSAIGWLPDAGAAGDPPKHELVRLRNALADE